MGREVKRVPTGFDWPLRKVWGGYTNPYSAVKSKCVACEGTGYSEAARSFKEEWYGHKEWVHNLSQEDVDDLVAADRIRELTHTWSQKDGWVAIDPPPVLTASIVNAWSRGHSWELSSYTCIENRCKREGFPVECPLCKGSGDSWPTAAHKALAEAWQPIEPPVGDAWQMWETTTEGSPISPAFATPEELARWLADTKASSFGSCVATYEQWLTMITGPGWAPSMVATNGSLTSGVEAVG